MKLGISALRGNTVKTKGRLFASVIAIGFVGFTGTPAVATCLPQPNLADSGHLYYGTARLTNRNCQASRKEARSATSSPPSLAKSQVLAASPSAAQSPGLLEWLFNTPITNNMPNVAAKKEAPNDQRRAEPAGEPSSG